jgi:hypothetical protein
MTFFKKNRLLTIAILIELFLLLFAACDFFVPRLSIHMEGADLPVTGGIYQNGWHINSSIGSAGYFTYGPKVALTRGIYNITIQYSCDSEGNLVSCLGSDTTLYSLKYDNIELNPENSSVTFTLWANKSISDFQVTTIYGGTGNLTVSQIDINQTYTGSVHLLFCVLLLSILADVIILCYSYYRTHDISDKTIRNIMILAGVIIFSTFPLYTDYLTEGHDLLFHLLRIEGIKDGLLSGQFPVKIQPVQLNGYGYAASVFYGDLFLYIPAFLRIIGFSIQDSYAWFIFLVNAATTLICYYSFRKMQFSDTAAVLGTILYSLSPYRLINIYGRAAVGEFTAMIFLPLLAAGLYKIFMDDIHTKNYNRNWILPVIAYTGIIESHILSCELVGAFTILICLLLIRKVFVKKRFIILCKVVIFTILANLGFMIPLADYMLHKTCIISSGIMTSSEIQQSGIYLARLFTFFLNGDSMPYTRKTFSEYGMQGEMGISVGAALLACFALFLYFILIKKKNKTTHYGLGVFCWILSAITLFMSLDIFPWDFFTGIFGKLISSIQFPWRIFGIGSLCIAIVGMCALEFIQKNYHEIHIIIFTTLILFTVVITSGWMLGDLLDNDTPLRIYSANALPTATSGTFYNEYAPIDADDEKLDGNYILSSDSLILSDYVKQYTTIRATVTNTSDTDQYIELPLFYYPGYQVKSSDAQITCTKGNNGLIRITVPSGCHCEFTVSFHTPVPWRIGEIISLFTILSLTYLLIAKKKSS